MKLIIGSDHAGFPLKQALLARLRGRGVQVVDAGTGSGDLPVDYPDYAQAVAGGVACGEFERGVLICGSGQGMSIAANRRPGVRAALCQDEQSARLARAHNDSNVLCMGAWMVTPERAESILEAWLGTAYEAGRHAPRVAKLDRLAPGGDAAELAGRFSFGVALSPTESPSSPLLFMGRIEHGLAAAAEVGLQLIEVSLRHPQDLPAALLDALPGQPALSLSAFATGQSCLHDSLCLGDPDPEVRRRTILRLQAIIDLAQSFGAPVIIGGLRGGVTDGPGEARAQLERAMESVRTCARYAQGRGVTLLIEPINRYETSSIHTAAEGIAAISEIGEANVKLLLDTFHMNIEEGDLPQTFRLAKDHLAYVHLADSNRRTPGQGHIDFATILAALAEIDYRGPLVGEFLPLPDDRTAVLQFGDFVRSFRQGDPLERAARARSAP